MLESRSEPMQSSITACSTDQSANNLHHRGDEAREGMGYILSCISSLFCSHSLKARYLSATVKPTFSLHHSLPFSALPLPSTYIVGTLLHYISELFQLLHDLARYSSPLDTSYFPCRFSWYVGSFTLLFSSLTLNIFFTPSILRDLSAELPSKNGQTFPHLLLYAHLHIAKFDAFALVTT